MMSDTSYLSVSEWLQTLKLDLYSDLFEKHDFHTVSDLRHLSDDFLLHMGIQLPGHRKRILASLHKSVPQELENEGGRPIPKKRSIFVTTSCQPECPVPNVEPAAPPEPRGSTKNAHVPPPIPPRVTRVPPLKFSTTPPKSVSPISLPESYPAEETPCSPTLASFCPSPFTPDVFGYTENNEHEEEPPKVAAPPLPLKRHKLPERKSRTPPPLPVRPRKPSPPLPSSIGSDSDLSTQRSSSSLSSGISSGNMEDGEPQYTTVIKAGWLDKNPPQGSYIFQKRWVKLDTDYLRYYDSDKDMYSKRMIRTSAIAKVASMGDQKFEVATSNRNFMFRAESDGERNDWVRAVQQILDERKMKVPCNPTLTLENPDKCGPLEMKGCKPKLFVAVAADKVYLYKNAEDYCSGVGITSIDMNVGNVKEVDKKSFDLTTPYKTFSFVAESEQERGDWVEAMMQSVAGALSNPEVAKKIWSVEANRRCADCDAPNPEWASINLCVVICKKCAGEHRSLGPNISKVRSLKMDNKIWTDELIQALCVAVTSSDLTETQALVFCGADISCTCGDEFFSQPLDLAQQSGQRLQEEFLKQNRTSETPRLDLGTNLEKQYYIMQHSITHNGYLYKTSSMAKLVTDRKAKEEFSRRWCVLNDGVLSYYETNHSSSPNGEIRMDEIVCVAVIPPETHGYDSTFEIYTKSERLYLFAADKQEEAREWVKSITKCFLPPKAEELLSYDFDRIGRLQFKGGRSLERSMVGWFSLCKTNLYTYVEEKDMVEVTNLKKLSELCTITYMQGERKLDFSGWVGAIQKASSTSGDTLSEQQLTNSDVPFIVDKCIEHISRFGVESEGIYRKSGQKSKITNLLEALKKDARSVVFKEEEPVDNVSDTLKRFFREIGEGIFAEHCRQCVQHFSDVNQMNVHNLAIVFGPTLFQTDGQNYKPGRVVEDLINFYQEIFNVSTQEIQKQLDIFYKIMKLRSSQTKPRGTDFICSVYLREKKPECEQSVHIAVTMTAQELMETLLERRNICPKDGEYWSCVEVDTTEEIERPLHFSEKVLPVFHTNVSSSTHLIVKEDPNMDAMLFYIKNRVGDSKNGMMKFREDKSLLDFTMKFHDRYFMLNSSTLRMYREIRSHRPEKEWAVKNLTIYLGIKKKIMRAPTGWGFTIMSKNEKNEKSQCLWPEESTLARMRNSRQDPLLGNRSLIPIRGSEMDIRRSMAAFTADPLTGLEAPRITTPSREKINYQGRTWVIQQT
uniref:Uncharacterized protein n=1 Tax=Pyxicephalus adspersus TaxID=30357 RepID=A0AAV3B7L8_PYXAD|nr:TPA: hypothetical protein GDO54_000056 [Pyxicephalus adspersus]